MRTPQGGAAELGGPTLRTRVGVDLILPIKGGRQEMWELSAWMPADRKVMQASSRSANQLDVWSIA
jgi:hypothetical protein